MSISLTWKQNLKEGPYQEYFENGQVKITGYFKNDVRDGTFELYTENGDLKEEITYEKGKKI